ncbi:MAG: hypothetical protein IKF96_00690, partial [Eggerthellaceae bacterium]|nr:hypothetical protein [Eggerthellaceae bacterium]
MTVREEFGDKIIDRMPDWTVAEEAFLADIKAQLEAQGLKFVKYLPNMFTFRCVVGNAENTKWINVVGEDTRKDAAWMDHVSLRRMSSEREAGYESINGQNGDAWYTGDGMLYLYTAGRAQYDAPWWRGTDKYHMPGVTADTQERLNCSINYGMEYKNERDFVGGVALDRMYLTTAMDFRSFHCEEDLHVPDEGYGRSLPLHHCTLEGKKAWFFLDRGVLALGCDIRASDGFEVHTTVENRLLPEDGRPVTVDGRALLPTEDLQVFPGAKALHIPGVGGCVLL